MVSGNTFVARDVPLIEGGNILTATATDGARPRRHRQHQRGARPDGAARGDPSPAGRVALFERDGHRLRPGQRHRGRHGQRLRGDGDGQRHACRRRQPLLRRRGCAAGAGRERPHRGGHGRERQRRARPRSRSGWSRRRSAACGDRLRRPADGRHRQRRSPSPWSWSCSTPRGQPVAGRPVLFKVRGNDGTLDGGEPPGGGDHRTGRPGRGPLHARARGPASATRPSRRRSPGFRGPAVFTATALPGEPALIVVDSGDQQIGVAGQPLPRPLVAVVDRRRATTGSVACRCASGWSQGDGQLRRTASRRSGRDRQRRPRDRPPSPSVPRKGSANNVVEAAIDGPRDSPVAASSRSGRTAGDPAATSISGVVLDNSNLPVAGRDPAHPRHRAHRADRRAGTVPHRSRRRSGTVKLIVDGCDGRAAGLLAGPRVRADHGPGPRQHGRHADLPAAARPRQRRSSSTRRGAAR